MFNFVADGGSPWRGSAPFRSVLPALLLVPFLVPAATSLAGDAGGEKVPPEDIQILIERLGAGTWAERHGAAVALEGMGSEAFEALHRASLESDDPEIRHRARRVLERCLWRGLPGSQRESFRGFFHKPLDEKSERLIGLVHSSFTLGWRNLRTYLERAYLYDPDPRIRDLALSLMGDAGLLFSRDFLLSLLDRRPSSASRLRIGIALSKNGFPAEALPLLENEDAENPGVEALLERVRSLTALGRVEEALAPARTVLETGAGSPFFDPATIGRAYLAAGKIDALLSLYRAFESDARDRIGLAALLASRGETEPAVSLLDPEHGLASGGWEDPAASLLRIRILARNGRGKEALAALASAVETEGRDGPGVLVQARALARRGEPEGVLRILTPPEGEDLQSAALLLERARILVSLGREKDAAALLLSPASRETLLEETTAFALGASELLSRMDRHGEAAELLLDALHRRPDETALAETAAEALEAAGRWKEARGVLLRALPRMQGRDDFKRTASHLIETAREGGTLDTMGEEIRKACRALETIWKRRLADRPPGWPPVSDPDRVPLLCLQSRIEAVRGEAREARRLLNVAFELSSGSSRELVLAERIALEASAGEQDARRFFGILLQAVHPGMLGTGRETGLSFLLFAWRFADPTAPGEGPAGECVHVLRQLLPLLWKVRPLAGPPPPLLLAPFPLFASYLSDLASGRDTLPADLWKEALPPIIEGSGEEAVSVLGELAAAGPEDLRGICLALLERRSGPQASRALLEVMIRRVGEFDWRRRAASALAARPLTGVRDELETLAAGPRGRMAQLASWILRRHGRREEAAATARLAADPAAAEEVRRFAVLALATPPEEANRELFLDLTGAPSPALRTAAAVALGILGDPRGADAIVRELASGKAEHLFNDLDAPSATGGKRIAQALLEEAAFPDFLVSRPSFLSPAHQGYPRFRDEAEASLEAMGGPGEAGWLLLLDTRPSRSSSWTVECGRFLGAVASWAGPEVCREALTCLQERFMPGGMGKRDMARAARLARRAGDEAEAAFYFARARRRLSIAGEPEDIEALVRMLCDFGREPERALAGARAFRVRRVSRFRALDLEARALAASGRRAEALSLLEAALSGLPERGRAGLAALASRQH